MRSTVIACYGACRCSSAECHSIGTPHRRQRACLNSLLMCQSRDFNAATSAVNFHRFVSLVKGYATGVGALGIPRPEVKALRDLVVAHADKVVAGCPACQGNATPGCAAGRWVCLNLPRGLLSTQIYLCGIRAAGWAGSPKAGGRAVLGPLHARADPL